MRKHLWTYLLLLLFAVVGLTACSKRSTSDQTTVKIGYNYAVNSVGLAAIAQKAQYFKDQGLNVKLVKFSDGAAELAAMKSGSIDIAEVGPGVLGSITKGQAQIVFFDGLSTSDQVIGDKAQGVSDIKSLKGKKVAVIQGTSSQMILDAALKKAGMTESDVKIVSMSAATINNALISGKVAAAATWAPGTSQITAKLGKQAVTLAKDADFTSNSPFPCSWVATKSFVKQHSALVKKFDTAMFKAMDYRYQGGKDAAKWIAQVLAMDEKDVQPMITSTEKLYSAKQVKQLIANGTLAKYYQQLQTNLINIGLISADADLQKPADYVETKLIKAAATAAAK
ncbi:ABC transporter substrate-binding protein [Lacticaseibacillus jixiensis]|uniref:ABC transporter substrate-binding protein n=1 Tax=Lacticaseibacillus jixiensis TaxID=3231926 RepID=UPI0036F3C381